MIKYFMISTTLKNTFFENIQNSSENFTKHFHNSYAISITNKGFFKSISQGKIGHSYVYSLRVINPYEVHEGISKEWSFTTFYPTIELMEEVYKDIFFEKKIPLFQEQIYNDKILYKLFFGFFQSVFLKKDNLLIETNAIRALSYLIKHYSCNAEKEISFDRPNSLKRALEYICDNLDKNITLDELSLVASLSKYHFLRLFKEHYGITPHKYILTQRVNRAKMLIKKEKNLSIIASKSGFCDQSHFIKSFKKIYGYTPSNILESSNILQY